MATIHVQAGQPLKIDHNNSPSYADELIMDDNSEIHVAGEISLWQFHCPKVTIGSNCKILAQGAPGANGADQTNAPWQADECKKGSDSEAQRGSDGLPGKKGISLTYVWGIASVGSLVIDTSGGDGGNGGRGGPGQQGGGAKCAACNGNDGGRGGQGANAGQGGDAGLASLTWYSESASDRLAVEGKLKQWGRGLRLLPQSASRAVPGIQFKSDGGRKGIPGVGGGGGRGGDGVGCGLYSMGGGNTGWPGLDGNPNADGHAMQPEIELITFVPGPKPIFP
jgi:hypothetical protein